MHAMKKSGSTAERVTRQYSQHGRHLRVLACVGTVLQLCWKRGEELVRVFGATQHNNPQ